MSAPDLGTATSGFLEEARSARLYRELADIEREPRIARMFRELAEAANQQAAFWAAAGLIPRLVKHGEEQGVILRAMVNDSMGFSPPLVITRDEVNEMLDRVGRALDALAVELRRESIAAV